MAQPEKRVIYYSKTTDDFAGTNIRTRKVDAAFPFARKGAAWKVVSFLLYYLIALPLVSLIIRAVNRTKIVNRKSLKHIKGGFFLYGNHTHWSDGFLPHVMASPRRTYVIAGPDAVSIKGLRSIVTMLGAIPVPTQPKALGPFSDAVKQRYKEDSCVAIYPEAHIWPYYTGIRPFPPTSFLYPAELGAPVVAMVTRYRERKGRGNKLKKPARTVILSDPIYPKLGLTVRQSQLDLHRRVAEFMYECAGLPGNFEYVEYRQREAGLLPPQTEKRQGCSPAARTTTGAALWDSCL